VHRGNSLGLVTVGIEELDQLEAQRTLGCHLGQGFLMARPDRPENVARVLREPWVALH
jgi:EAL domain-containing protein (putative c-di-GMP-specific phosphodiesterase class I)